MLIAALLAAVCSLLSTSDAFQIPWTTTRPPRRTHKTYEDHIVLRLTISDFDGRKAILEAVDTFAVDIWSRTSDTIDICLQSSITDRFFNSIPFDARNITIAMVPNLKWAIQRSLPQVSTTNSVPSLDDSFFSDYQTIESIDAWMKLVAALHSDFVSIEHLGTTHEGRPIDGLKIAKKGRKSSKKRKVILIQGAQHAREWISISTVCYLAYSLIAGHTSDPELGSMVADFDWLFIPTLNVDGYAYSFEDRLWRKNRQPTTIPFCKGIDLDRNWGFGWSDGNTATSLSNPCSENYQGSRAFEAHETKALSKYIKDLKKSTTHKLVGYLDLHSYAQTILYPYALSCDMNVRDEESLLELGVGASRAMKAASGEHYDTESACNQDGHIFAANMNSGAALDWVYSQGTRWSYVVKLRDTGSYGFLVPKEEIIPTGQEMLLFLKYYSTFIQEH